jgi:hypothetical protein
VNAYLAKPPAGVRRVDPLGAELAPILREIEAAEPAPVKRVWEGKGRKRKARLDEVCELSAGEFLHVPWLREPRRRVNQILWYGAAGAAALVVGGVTTVFLGKLIRGAVLGALAFSAVVGASFRARTGDSRRAAEPDGGGGLPGFICLEDRLLIRYPDALYELPQSAIRRIARKNRGHIQGENAMVEYEMVAELDAADLTIAEVVDLHGHAEGADISERMAVLLAVASWLDEVWLAEA